MDTDAVKRITVLDTDVGTDDACALLLLTVLPRKPDYIVASFGNTSLENACRNALLLKRYLGLEADVVRGLPPPDPNAAVLAEKNTFHGSDGLAGCADALAESLSFSPEKAPVLSFDDLRQRLSEADEVVYVTIGALYNLSVLLDDPAVRPRLKRICCMGGGIRESNAGHDAEFNFSKNPAAVRKLFSSGLPVTLFPLDVTNHQRMTGADLARLERFGVYPFYLRFLRHNEKANRVYNHIPAAVLHDALPVLYLSRPALFTFADAALTADEYGHLALSCEGARVRLCTGVAEGAVCGAMEEAFREKK